MSELSVPRGDHAAALDPPRAYGAPLGRVRVRAEAEDFCVEECLGFAPAGAGAHVLLRVRKRDANTAWVAGELARLARDGVELIDATPRQGAGAKVGFVHPRAS
ncbi:MAG: tRNA pseudouridine(13) synthase TruD, partial [Pseudomonadota bacterium]|nr:tRNA pseudouridine(13) synthase TruD [Pseudomonadota bacterium]